MPKKQELLQLLTRNKAQVVFVSPHFDDAALSCGSLIAELSKHKKVKVINVFTKAHSGPYTFSAKKFLKISGDFKNANKLYKAREQEDRDALQSINVNKIINLGLHDSLFRKKNPKSKISKVLPEFDHLYPTFRFHIKNTRFSKNDNSLKMLKIRLKKHVTKNSIVFVPYNIANHVDHMIVRQACEELFENIFYYSEFPYNITNEENTKTNFRYYKLNTNNVHKTKLLKMYKTQFAGLFPTNVVPKHKEVFFRPNEKIANKKTMNEDNLYNFLTLSRFIYSAVYSMLFGRKIDHKTTPKIVNHTLVKNLRRQKGEDANSVGIYTNDKGEKSVVKHLSYSNNLLDYYHLENEASILTVLQNHEYRDGRDTVKFPKVFDIKKTNKEFMIRMEYLEGKLLKDIHSNEKAKVLQRCISALMFVSENSDPDIKKSIPKRGRLFMTLSLPFYFSFAVKKNYREVTLYLKMLISFYMYMFKNILEQPNYDISHKCLHDENIIVNGNTISIIDLQLSSLAVRYSDLAIITRIFLDQIGISNTLELVKKYIKFDKDLNSFISLSIYYSIQTLATSYPGDHYHLQSERYIRFLDNYLIDNLKASIGNKKLLNNRLFVNKKNRVLINLAPNQYE